MSKTFRAEYVLRGCPNLQQPKEEPAGEASAEPETPATRRDKSPAAAASARPSRGSSKRGRAGARRSPAAAAEDEDDAAEDDEDDNDDKVGSLQVIASSCALSSCQKAMANLHCCEATWPHCMYMFCMLQHWRTISTMPSAWW